MAEICGHVPAQARRRPATPGIRPPVLSREQVPAIGTSGKMNKFWMILNEMRRGDVEYLELAGASVANVQSMISRLFNSLGWCRMRSAASADGRYLIVYRQQ